MSCGVWFLRQCCSSHSFMRLDASAWRCSFMCFTGRSSDGGFARRRRRTHRVARLPILAVEEVAHRPSPSFIGFHQSLAFVGVHHLLRRGSVFGFAARRAAVGKAGFIRLQFKLFAADGAHLERKCHPAVMIQPTPMQFALLVSRCRNSGCFQRRL